MYELFYLGKDENGKRKQKKKRGGKSKEVNVNLISERLGHSNIKVTLDFYSHVLPTMQEEVSGNIYTILRYDQIMTRTMFND
ncbi:hypothetical protein GCM10009865_54140 [Aeromicrobium ponti]|uniref:Integrase n=1 Tax=Cytobacillus oceanisediminis TaxID=665099 RepID=A0A562J4P8_9BACI|nr:hypothetical protein IQ19_05533 [Cytobacillus oceanisediminis]